MTEEKFRERMKKLSDASDFTSFKIKILKQELGAIETKKDLLRKKFFTKNNTIKLNLEKKEELR